MCVGKIEQLTENKSSLNGIYIEDMADTGKDYVQTKEDKDKIITALVKQNEADKKKIQELKKKNERLTLALLGISNEMIALAKKNKDVKQETLWKNRKQSYLFNK